MEILRPAFGILRCADRHLRQGGSQGYQFGFGDRHTYDGDTFYYVGYRLIRLARGRDKGHPASFVAVLVLSGAATGLSWLFYFKALQTGDVSRVAPIDKLSVVITICLSFLFLKEEVSLRVVVGALLITCGSIIMLLK